LNLDLDAVKEEDFPKLLEYARWSAGKVATLTTETTEGRAKFKKVADERDAWRTRAQKLGEHQGIEDDADLDALPPKSKDVATEAAKQYEVKLKRQEREIADLTAKLAESVTRSRKERERAVIAEAVAAHDFSDDAKPYVVDHLSAKMAWESDEDGPQYKESNGKTLSIRDAVAGIAATKPGLLKPTGTGGAGVRSGHAGSVGNGKDLSHLSPVERLNAARAVKTS